MYREIISDFIKDNQWAHIAVPASESEIRIAEEYLGYEFPHELKKLYLELDGDNYFILSLNAMKDNVKLNREIFPDCFDTFEEYLDKIDRYIPFATNGCGDYYCYRVDENGIADESDIYLWEHELFSSHPVATDIKDAIIKYYNNEI